MREIMMMVMILGLAGGAQAAGICAGKLTCIPGVPGSGYSAELAVRASDLKDQAARATAAIEPVPVPAGGTEALRAEAAADTDKFIDEHTPEEVSRAFGLFPPRFQITNLGRIEEAAVQLTVDLARQRLVVKSPTLNAEFPISSGVPGHPTSGSGKCFAPDFMEEMHYSSLYNNAPMPHSVFFNGNIAVHATSAANEALLGQPASHGCVRLSGANAETVFGLIRANGKGNTTICVQGAPPK